MILNGPCQSEALEHPLDCIALGALKVQVLWNLPKEVVIQGHTEGGDQHLAQRWH